MIVKIFNTNMIIIIFEDNLVYELNYTNSFSTKKKYIYGWVYFSGKKHGWIDICLLTKGFHKFKIIPTNEILLFIENGDHEKNKLLNLKIKNHDFYYHPKYNSLIPEWLPNNVIQILNFIENNKVSEIITKSKNDVQLRKNLSKLAGFLYMDSESRLKILDYINVYAIDISLYKYESWNNLNEFLYRKLLNYPTLKTSDILHSPVEAQLKIITENNFYIKGNKFNFTSLVNENIHFNNAILFRMLPSFYHRIHSPFRLKLKNIKHIPGDLYSIRPNTIIENDALVKNERYVLTFSDNSDYNIYMIIIGSIFIGSIKIYENKINTWISPGEEIGYFKFGGSSIVLLIEKDIEFKIGIYDNYETKVEIGTPIGNLKKTKNIIYNFDNSVKLPDTTKESTIKLICEICIYLFLIFFYKYFLFNNND